MSRNRWKQVSELFQAALDRPRTERESFLREVCSGDLALLEEVERLLEADSEAGGFLEESPLLRRQVKISAEES